MPGGTFPQPVADLVATLRGIFELKKRPEIVEVLTNAHGRFEQTNFDNWNGGTYTWALRLEVAVSIYAAVEPRLSSMEEEILGQCVYLARLYSCWSWIEAPAVCVAASQEGITPMISSKFQRVAPNGVEYTRCLQRWFCKLRIRCTCIR